MARLLHMPAVAANAAEAVLQAWTVGEDAEFAAGDVIATVETDKAMVDVEADAPGVLLRRLVDEGAAVAVGVPIALLGAPGERPGDLDPVLADLGAVGAPAPGQPPAERGAVAAGQSPAKRGAVAASAASGAVLAPGRETGLEPGSPRATRIFASPLARRLAREAGLNLEEIGGTGPNGRISRRDVQAAAAAAARPTPTPARPAPPTLPPAAPAAAPAPATPPAPPTPPPPAPRPADGGPAFIDIPHSRLRRAAAQRLTASKRDAPHFYLSGQARVDALLDLRRALNEGGPVRISVNDLIVRAAALAHTRVPAMNVIWTDDAVRSFSRVDLALAVATPQGLVTPVLRGVDTLTITAVARATQDLAGRAAAGQLRQEDLEGGTLTITNLGMHGVREFAAIINPPHAAILAVGAAAPEPVVTDGALAVATVLRVTLSVDHRPVDGVVAAAWMREFLRLLENPLQILA